MSTPDNTPDYLKGRADAVREILDDCPLDDVDQIRDYLQDAAIKTAVDAGVAAIKAAEAAPEDERVPEVEINSRLGHATTARIWVRGLGLGDGPRLLIFDGVDRSAYRGAPPADGDPTPTYMGAPPEGEPCRCPACSAVLSGEWGS